MPGVCEMRSGLAGGLLVIVLGGQKRFGEGLKLHHATSAAQDLSSGPYLPTPCLSESIGKGAFGVLQLAEGSDEHHQSQGPGWGRGRLFSSICQAWLLQAVSPR